VRSSRRCAIWFAAAVSVLALLALGAGAASPGTHRADAGARLQHVAVDHDAVVPARPAAERSLLDVWQVPGKLLLAWVGVLLCAALRVATAGRTIPRRVGAAGSSVPTRRRFVRGPPALALA
jgi:hypothetical protein